MTDTDRIALITGGNRGLGRATALALAEDGVDAVITYRSNEDEARRVVADLQARGRRAAALHLEAGRIDTFGAFRLDLLDVLRERWGRDTIDHLVNNAGHAAMTPLGGTAENDVDLLFDVQFKGPFFLTQTLAPMITDGGSIVNLSSGLARFAGDGWSVYGSLKAATEQLTRYHAKELGGRGIRVNAIAPGPIATDFAGGAMRDNEQARAAMSGVAALGRIGEADDIGPVIAFLLSPAAGWITGQRLEASGGTLL